MRIKLVKPVTVRLSSQRGGLVIWEKVSEFRAVSHVIPRNPRTADQEAVRGFMGEAKRAWATLNDEEKAQWSAFAEKNFIINSRYFGKQWRGIDAFCRAGVARQVAGYSALPELPDGPRPSPVEFAELLPGSDPHELVFSVVHNLGKNSGGEYRLMVRMTPSASTYARRPYDKQLRYARGTGPESVVALPNSGDVVTMSGVRFALVPGMNYAIELRLLRVADGAVSDAYYQCRCVAELSGLRVAIAG